MELTIASHPVSRIVFGTETQLRGTALSVERDELRQLVLEDPILENIELAVLSPGESGRAGPIFDIVEPRAKDPGQGADFPGILGPAMTAGIGTTHVLAGAAVSIVAEMSPDETRSPTGRVLEMSGAAAEGSHYASLHHLIIIPRSKAGASRHAILKAYRLASLKVAVRIARAAIEQRPASVHTFPSISTTNGRDELGRVAYVGQIFSRQRKPGIDEPILYGANTEGMLPVLLHPDEWLDGAIVPSLHSWFGGTETYFYQNHPIVLELYRRHEAHEINFAGTVATVAGAENFDRERQCRAAANLVRWALHANGAVLSKYGGGLPHTDLAETARLLEGMGIATGVMVSDVSRDRRVESALLFNVPEVDAIVYNGGNGTQWQVSRAERVIAATPEFAEMLAGPMTIEANNIIGVTNQQGASRMRSMIY